MLVTSVTSYLHAASDQSSTFLIHRFYCQSDSDNQGWEGYFENVLRYSYLWHLKKNNKNKNKKPPLLHMKIKTRESKYRWDDFHLNSNECVFCMNFCILITQSHYMYSVTPQAWGILLTLLALLIHKWNTYFQVFITKQKICFIVALWSTYYGLYERLHIYLLGKDERWCVDRIKKKKKKSKRTLLLWWRPLSVHFIRRVCHVELSQSSTPSGNDIRTEAFPAWDHGDSFAGLDTGGLA